MRSAITKLSSNIKSIDLSNVFISTISLMAYYITASHTDAIVGSHLLEIISSIRATFLYHYKASDRNRKPVLQLGTAQGLLVVLDYPTRFLETIRSMRSFEVISDTCL